MRREANSGEKVLIDVTGTKRRLQALQAMGWTSRNIAERYGDLRIDRWGAGRGTTTVSAITVYMTRTWIQPETAARLAGVYDELSMKQPPDLPGNRQVRKRSLEKGWAPPLAWDDEAIDDPDAMPSGLTRERTWKWLVACGTAEQRDRWIEEVGWLSRRRKSA